MPLGTLPRPTTLVCQWAASMSPTQPNDMCLAGPASVFPGLGLGLGLGDTLQAQAGSSAVWVFGLGAWAGAVSLLWGLAALVVFVLIPPKAPIRKVRYLKVLR